MDEREIPKHDRAAEHEEQKEHFERRLARANQIKDILLEVYHALITVNEGVDRVMKITEE